MKILISIFITIITVSFYNTLQIDNYRPINICDSIPSLNKKIMPTIYKYLGYFISFYSHEHTPIHVHVKTNGKESVIELYFNGNALTLTERIIKGKKPLDEQDLREVKIFIRSHKEEIIKKWNDYHIKHLKLKTKILTTKVRKAKKK